MTSVLLTFVGLLGAGALGVVMRKVFPAWGIWVEIDKFNSPALRLLLTVLILSVSYLYFDGGRERSVLRAEKDDIHTSARLVLERQLKTCQSQKDSLNNIRLEEALEYQKKYMGLLESYKNSQEILDSTIQEAKKLIE